MRSSYVPLVVLAVFAATPALAQASFEIIFVENLNEISPRTISYSLDRRVEVTLTTNGRVSERQFWRSRTASATTSHEGAFRQESSTGTYFRTSWRVGSASHLIRTREFASHVETMELRVSGQSCSITLSNQLKPGFSAYERFTNPTTKLRYSNISLGQNSCRVVQGGT